MPPVLFVYVLDNLLAALVLEIDVDIGSFIAFATNKSFEQKIVLARINAGYAKTKADRAICGRAAALTQDVSRSGEADQIPNGQKIGFVAQILDNRKFMLEHDDDGVRNAARVAFFGPFPSQLFEVVNRCYTCWRCF